MNKCVRFSLIRTDSADGSQRVRVLEAGKLMERMSRETRYRDVTKWRACLREQRMGEDVPHYKHLDRLPMVMPAVHLVRSAQDGGLLMKRYNGIVLLSVGPLQAAELSRLKLRAASVPQTFAAFVDVGGDTLEILVPFVRPDGSLPQSEVECGIFHTHALQVAVRCYQPLLGCAVRQSEPSPYAAFRMSFDAQPFYNALATPIVMAQPDEGQQPLPLPVGHVEAGEGEEPVPDDGGEVRKESRMVRNVALLGDFLQRNYEVRHNLLLNVTEFRSRGAAGGAFRPFDQNARNSIALNAMGAGLEILDRDVDRFLCSDRVPRYNPVEDYLNRVGEWDGVDHIRRLAARVCTGQPLWPDFFYRWFLGMVAHWQNRDGLHGHCTTPILVGAQGTRKSTFCRNILPPELRFGYSESIDVSNKREAELSLSRFLLINLDEFDQISLRHQAFLKNLLQKPAANLRRPYSKSVEEMRRYASFIATSNHDDLLSDTSGARRYICVRVTGVIDVACPIDYRQLYAQALAALRSGERWWFDAGEEKLLMRYNREFERVSPMEQTFLQAFCVPETQDGGEWYTAEQLLMVLHRQWHLPLSDSNRIFFGRIMKKLGVPSQRTRFGMRYRVSPFGDETAG